MQGEVSDMSELQVKHSGELTVSGKFNVYISLWYFSSNKLCQSLLVYDGHNPGHVATFGSWTKIDGSFLLYVSFMKLDRPLHLDL